MTTKTDAKITANAERLVARLIADIEANPHGGWTKPWTTALSDLPANASTGKAYRGSNVWTLALTAMLQGYTSPQWATYKQWAALGHQVQKGEKGTLGIFAGRSPVKDKQGNIRKDDSGREIWRYVRRTFTLFNREQTDAPALEIKPTLPVDSDWWAIDCAQEIYATLEIDHRHAGSRAYYTPATDKITLPPVESFFTPMDYFATAVHEAAHWTGHADRLDREGITGLHAFGTPGYAREELTVELAAVLIGARYGFIESDSDHDEHRANSAAYLVSWLRETDPENLYGVLADAEAIANLIAPEQVAAEEEGEEQALAA